MPTEIAYFGFSSKAASQYHWPELWFDVLAQPHRHDDEGSPDERSHLGDWTWHRLLEERYGAENVERMTPSYLLLTQVYYQPLSPPAPSDTCAYRKHGRTEQDGRWAWVCDGSCEHPKFGVEVGDGND